MTTQCVQVKLELGHKATVRSKPTTEGFTHDWTVWVRGPENSNIQHFVEKVIFYLHESFQRPKRIVKDPPFQVSESGYAGFVLPIEVYFKNKEDPKLVTFEYDLFLHVGGPPVNHIRCEKLTFQNPTEDFRIKLIKAGGVGILTPDGGTVLGQPEAASTDSSVTISSKPSASPEQSKKPKPLSSSKNSASIVPPRQQPATTEPFVALFGQPIKTSKPSPDSRKNKVDKDPSKNGSGKTSKSSSGRPAGGAPVMAARKEPKLTTSKVKKKEEKKADGETKKRKRLPSNTSTSSKVKEVKKKKKNNDSDVEKEKEKEKPKPKPKAEKKKKTIKESKKSDSDDTSPGSSISLSTLNISGKRGPLGTLMAELDANDDGELVSPLSSDPPSPPQFSTSKKEKPLKMNSFEQELQHLHQQISLLQNRDQLQQITDIIEETGLYTVTQNSFDFDLHALDNETIRKLILVTMSHRIMPMHQVYLSQC